ncbi:MAG: hypothetical protein HUU60_04040 [Armatimonadetes bacterium]|nr:hypothetical protein [Armatimonadota bacterium]
MSKTTNARERCNLVAVQMAWQLEDYASPEAFCARIDALGEQIARSAAQKAIVVFPEDVGLGLAFTQHFDLVKSASSAMEAGSRMIEAEQERIQPLLLQGDPPVRAMLRLLSPFIRQHYEAAFSRLAARHGWWVVAGSAPINLFGSVYNASFVYDSSGELVQIQCKTRLVDEEREIGLQLSEAPLDSLGAVDTPYGVLGTMICYDAFHEEVSRLITDKLHATILAQPSCNLPPWTPQEAAGWRLGLAKVVENARGAVGINPMMVGKLFDLTPQGRSTILAHSDFAGQDNVLAAANSHDQEEIVVYEYDPSEFR